MPTISITPGARRCATAQVLCTAAAIVFGASEVVAQELRVDSVPETIIGRVASDSGRALGGAIVIVTRGPDRLMQQTKTDSAGRFRVLFARGTGDYLVAVQIPGFRSARRRVTRVDNERSFTVDFVLAATVGALDAIRVTATRPVRVATITRPTIQEVGSNERWRDGVVASLPPTLLGDAEAASLAVAGTTATPSGTSLLGSDPSGTLLTLNGMVLAGGALPRASRLDTRVTGATFDATRGGFAGANVDMRLAPGNRMYQNRNAYLTVVPAELQVVDALGRSLGAIGTTMRASVGADGELVRQTLTYNVAADISRRSAPAIDLAFTPPAVLSELGLSPDSLARVRRVAGGLGVPVSDAQAPRDVRRTVSLLARFDDVRDSLTEHSATLYTALVDGSRDGITPLAAASTVQQRSEHAMGAMWQRGTWSGNGLNRYRRTSASGSYTRSARLPNSSAPAISVLLPATTEDTSSATSVTLALGGPGTGPAEVDRWTGEIMQDWMANMRGQRHQLKANVWGRVDALHRAGGDRTAGEWRFTSLSDLEARRPAAYTRVLGTTAREATVWNAAAAMSHTWNPTRFLSLIYGARLEGAGTLRAPRTRDPFATTTGESSWGAAARVHVSPRLGFTYNLRRRANNTAGTSSNQSGIWFRYPSGVLRGGFGAFRDLWRPDPFAGVGMIDITRAPVVLRCVGSIAPRLPRDLQDLPTQCADGGSALAEQAPVLERLHRRWDSPRSWRASLDYNASRWSLMVRASMLGSYDLSRSSTIDRNFDGTPRFVLAAEGERPVFVTPSAIDPGSGLLSALDSRRSTALGSINEVVSDLRGRGGQITLSISPDRFDHRWRTKPFLQLAYTLQRVDRQVRGFDGVAFGDPRLKEWVPAPADARHLWIAQVGHTGRFGTVSTFARVQSGLPFSPLVDGDVNGDGRAGDRAWVPTPALSDDRRLADGIDRLLHSGSGTARKCLQVAIARPRDARPCRGPWSTTWTASWSPPLNLASRTWRSRMQLSVVAENILAGVDRLVHGAARPRGWGGAPAIDPVLLRLRGFDPTRRRYLYEVNPEFAQVRPTHTTRRDPFRVTLDLSLRLGTDYDLQALRRVIEPVRVGPRWERRSADSVLAWYLRTYTASIHRALIYEADSLFLTAPQVQHLRTRDSVFSAEVHALFRPVADLLASAPQGRASALALDSVRSTMRRYWALFWTQPELAADGLLQEQVQAFPLLREMLLLPAITRRTSEWTFPAPVPLTYSPASPRR